MSLVNFLFDPFLYHKYMIKALIACCALSLSVPLVGSFLLLRRMSLIGDALSHAILPGVVVGYYFCGMSLMAMRIGGIISGFLVAVCSVLVSSNTLLKEDASFSGFYLGSLSLGILLMSANGESNVDFLHILFGSVMLMDSYSIIYIGIVSSVTLVVFSVFYRALVIESFDANFLRNCVCWYPQCIQILFLVFVVLNLIASFQVIGTLMSIGLMVLPVLSSRCWTTGFFSMILCSMFIAFICSYFGLLGSFYTFLPAGPIIVLFASIVFLFSIFFRKRI